MHFGFTLKPDMPVERIIALTRQAEAAGFTYGWMFDSHVLWKEPYPLLTLMADNTKKLRLGTCVTNPAVRDVTVTASLFATLNLISKGRMVLGIGRGDSSRRVLGQKPTTLETLEREAREAMSSAMAEEDAVTSLRAATDAIALPVQQLAREAEALAAALKDAANVSGAQQQRIQDLVVAANALARNAARTSAALSAIQVGRSTAEMPVVTAPESEAEVATPAPIASSAAA